MLVSLQVRDLAIIDHVDIALGRGLNVVTGETGAGKSILIDALSLAVGARAVPDLVRTGATQAEVTAIFDVSGRASVHKRLTDAGIEWDDELVVRRIVSPPSPGDRSGGRSRAYINGRMVSLAQLAQLTAGLADVTSQHEHQSLTDPLCHLQLLDASAHLDPLRQEVGRAHALYAEATQKLETLLRELRHRTDREDLLRYQLKEIDELKMSPGDEARWTTERDRLRYSSKLRDGSAQAEDLLYARDDAVIDQLGAASAIVADLAKLDASLVAARDAIEAARSHVEDAARVLGRYTRGVHSDPERLAEIEDSLAKLGRLKRKYGPTVEAILQFRAGAAEELANLEQGEARVHALEQAVEAARERAAQCARKLSAERKRAAQALGEAISRELATLGMGGARVVVDVTVAAPASGDLSVDGARLSASGIDRVEFLIAPNKGEEPRPLRKIASGGELSRALLAIKRVLTEVGDASLYVFDEVDSGVGGAVAEVIGQKLKAISTRNQTLVITHLPQIAVYADRHLVVGKRVVGERTVSEVRELSEAERTEEIARMLGGLRVTERTRAAAAEMIRAAET